MRPLAICPAAAAASIAAAAHAADAPHNDAPHNDTSHNDTPANAVPAIDPSVVTITVGGDNKKDVLIDTDKDQLKAAPQYRYLGDLTSGKH